MDKETKQVDTLSVSTISHGNYSSYETPPPAYPSKKRTTIALARIAATTILCSAFILGAFIVAGSYVSALTKCDCPQQTQIHDVPQAASFIGKQPEDKQDVLTKPEELPAKIREKVVEEVKVPIAITTTTAAPEEINEDNDLTDSDDTTENVTTTEAPEQEEPDVPQKIMELLQKMLQVDPDMRGNMKCRVLKQPHPFEPNGKPMLQVHCRKSHAIQVIKPISSLQGPKLIRIPSPLTPSGMLRMGRPMMFPIKRINSFPPHDPTPLRFGPKPERPGLNLPSMLRLMNLPRPLGPVKHFRPGPFQPPEEEEEEEENVPFPIFSQRRSLFDDPAPRPKLRFVVPIRKDQDEPPFRSDFTSQPEIPQPPEEEKPLNLPFPIFRPFQQQQSIIRPFQQQQSLIRPNPFLQPQENSVKIPERHLVPPPDLGQEERRPDFFPPPINDEDDDEIQEPQENFRNEPPSFIRQPQFFRNEEDAPEVPEPPVVIPLRQEPQELEPKESEPEPEKFPFQPDQQSESQPPPAFPFQPNQQSEPQPPPSFPFQPQEPPQHQLPPQRQLSFPFLLLDRIRNIQQNIPSRNLNIPPPNPISPRTYHLNKQTISDADRRGLQPPVEIEAPQ